MEPDKCWGNEGQLPAIISFIMEGKCPRVGGESAQVSRITNHDSGPAQVRQTHALCFLASASSLLAEGPAYCKIQTKKADFFLFFLVLLWGHPAGFHSGAAGCWSHDGCCYPSPSRGKRQNSPDQKPFWSAASVWSAVRDGWWIQGSANGTLWSR